MDIQGIYKIVNKLDDSVIYVGGSYHGLRRRFTNYNSLLPKGKYPSKKLQRIYDEIGSENFVFEIIEIINNATPENIRDRENFWIKTLNPIVNKNKAAIKTVPINRRENMCKAQSGESNPRCKLTIEDVNIIKELLSYKVKQKTIAKLFNIHQVHVSRIKHGTRWQNAC